jgi:tetratricopeptide (TPR) repeat protein/predicted Ser/Thr protein kinase
MIGETVYHYRILDKIGEGGMGVVYRAEDINLRRTVALKFLSSTSVQHGSSRERVMKEARAAASLDHQNICAIHEVEELDDKLFIVMAYCEGSTLGDILRKQRPGLKRSFDILIQIADGLCAAHEEGIIHRDIKPANVIVSDKGRVKIMDFGLAKQSGAETLSMTMAGAGTLSYMSPEQIRGDHIDPRSDIWSLGVMMYQILTGEKPFEGDYDASVLYRIVNEPHVPAVELDEDIPPEVNSIVERALQKSPEDRYESMRQMHDELVRVRRILFGEPDTVSSGKMFFPGSEHIFGWKVTSILALSVSAVLLFFLVRYFVYGEGSHVRTPAAEKDAATATASQEERDRAEELYQRGQELYNDGRQEEGVQLMEQALEVYPDHFSTLMTLASYYSWGNDSKKALELVDRAERIAVKKPDIIRCSAIDAKVRHQWNMAVKHYRELYELDPSLKSIPIHIGYIQSRYLGDLASALEQYRLYFDIDPENELGKHGDVHNYCGTALLYSGDFDGAIEEYQIYKSMMPDSPGPETSLANAYLVSGDYAEAYRLYSNLLSLDEPGFTVYEGLGRTCLETGRLREAAEHFHKYLGSVDFTGMKVKGRLYLARIHLIQKDGRSFDRVMADIDDLEPGSIQACWLRGIRHIRVEADTEKARREFSRMTSLMEKPFAFPEPSRRAHLRSLILFAENRHVGAFEAMAEAERRSPRDFFFFGRELARLLLESGRTGEAISKCLELSEFNPKDPELLMILCRAKHLDGDNSSAKEYYERTLEVLAGADEDYLPLIEFRNDLETDLDI